MEKDLRFVALLEKGAGRGAPYKVDNATLRQMCIDESKSWPGGQISLPKLKKKGDFTVASNRLALLNMMWAKRDLRPGGTKGTRLVPTAASSADDGTKIGGTIAGYTKVAEGVEGDEGTALLKEELEQQLASFEQMKAFAHDFGELKELFYVSEKGGLVEVQECTEMWEALVERADDEALQAEACLGRAGAWLARSTSGNVALVRLRLTRNGGKHQGYR